MWAGAVYYASYPEDHIRRVKRRKETKAQAIANTNCIDVDSGGYYKRHDYDPSTRRSQRDIDFGC